MDMATLTSLFQTMEAAGITPFNLVLLVMVYFMGVKLQIFPNLLGKKPTPDESENSVTLVSLYQQMQKLNGYFNHDTTEHLRVIEEKQDQILVMAADIKRKHEEYDRFGITCRVIKT
jgi:hypothetical protein